MLNPELEMADNLCVKSVALPVLIQLFSILELHNVLFLRIYTTGLLVAAVNWSPLPCLKGNEAKNPTQQSPTSPIYELMQLTLKSLLGIHFVTVIIASCIHRSQCSCRFTDANSDASLNCLATLQNLGAVSLGIDRVWQGTLGHQSVARYKGMAITPHVPIFPFQAVGIHRAWVTRESGLAREQECSSSSQSPFQLLVYLKQALSSLRFGKKVSQRNKIYLLLRLGYFSVKYDVFFTVGILQLKGMKHKEINQFCCICRVHCITQLIYEPLRFPFKGDSQDAKLYRNMHHHKCNCVFHNEYALLKGNRIGPKESRCEFCCV